jgi:hypothetical protein
MLVAALLAQPLTLRAQGTVNMKAGAAPHAAAPSGGEVSAPTEPGDDLGPAPDAAAAAVAVPQTAEPQVAQTESAETQTAEILAQLGGAEAPAVALDTSTPSIRFYGFMDVGVQRVWGSMFATGLGQSDALNFVLGNVNLYMDVTPAPEWRGLAEVRFTTFPNGAESLDPATGVFTRHSTTIFDYTAATGGFLSVDWGAIVLERAHVDWMPTDAFNMRVGYFLTPFGIWNVDHGSPTRIVLLAPTSSAYGFFPERQTGLQFFGLFHLAAWELGYTVYVSNGRTASVDFTDDKAFGGRLTLQTPRPVRLQLGVSGYYGKSQNVEKEVGVTNGELGIVRKTTVDLTEMVGGADISLDANALRVRIEGTVNQTIYEEGKRPIYGGAPRANSTSIAVFSIIAYQLPWLGMEPVVFGEYAHIPTPGIADTYLGLGAGLNFYITPSVIFRTLFVHSEDLENAGLTANSAGGRLIITY